MMDDRGQPSLLGQLVLAICELSTNGYCLIRYGHHRTHLEYRMYRVNTRLGQREHTASGRRLTDALERSVAWLHSGPGEGRCGSVCTDGQGATRVKVPRQAN